MSRNHQLAIGLAAAIVAGGVQAQGEVTTGTLKYRSFKTVKAVMPSEVWTDVAGGVKIAHPGGSAFAVHSESGKIKVDTTGDGKPNAEIKGSGGFLKFRSKTDGKTFEYAMQFKGTPGKYKAMSSCGMSGTVGGVPLQLFDLNGNGLYNEIGVDAMVVGKAKAASYLSKVVSFKGQLHSITVDESGRTVELTPFDGEAGTISLAAGFHSKGKLASVVVSDGQGHSFNLAGIKKGLVVPVGEYTIVAGRVTKGSQSARIRAGKMNALKVKDAETAKLVWGGKLMAEFDYTRDAGKVSVAPTALKYYGKAGEEYFDWMPNAQSPKFTVSNADNGKEEGSFMFSSC